MAHRVNSSVLSVCVWCKEAETKGMVCDITDAVGGNPEPTLSSKAPRGAERVRGSEQREKVSRRSSAKTRSGVLISVRVQMFFWRGTTSRIQRLLHSFEGTTAGSFLLTRLTSFFSILLCFWQGWWTHTGHCWTLTSPESGVPSPESRVPSHVPTD